MMGNYLLIEPLMFYIGLALSVGFCILSIVFILFLGKMPKAAKAIVTCWLKRRILVIDANEVGQFMFKPFMRKGHEGQLERDIGGGWTEVRHVPRHSNPIVATHYMLEDTGIPCFLSFSPKAIVFTPKMLAAMTVANTPVDKRGGLSKPLKEWAEKTNMPVELQELISTKLVDKEGNPLKDEETGEQLVKIDRVNKIVDKAISLLSFEAAEAFFKKTWSATDYQIQLRKYYLSGLERGRQALGLSGKLIPIIILVGIVIVAVVLFSGGGIQI